MSRNNVKEDSRKYYDWLEFASLDLNAAKVLLETGHCNGAAAFHCQQCIEKSLKAYSLFKTGRPLDGHNLTWLCRQAAKHDRAFNRWLDDSAQLNRYYIQTRYPSDMALPITAETVNHLYSVARDMYQFICMEVYGPGTVADD